jgi:hypothetical protein
MTPLMSLEAIVLLVVVVVKNKWEEKKKILLNLSFGNLQTRRGNDF